MTKEMKVTVVPFNETLDEYFKPPSKWFFVCATGAKYENFHKGWEVVDVVKQGDRYRITVKCKCGDTSYKFSSDTYKKSTPLCRCVTPLMEGHKWVKTPKGLYSISNKGVPYSYLAKRHMNPSKGSGGAKMAVLGGERFYMHKLVAHYFKGIPLDKAVGFLDGDKSNCTPENLFQVECVYSKSVGAKYGRLTVREVLQEEGKPRVLCDCECGSTLTSFASDVTKGHTKSCGCLSRDITTSRNTTHGMRYTGAYSSYQSMLYRCTKKKCASYPSYGGRGIKVCDRWLESFENFFEDMGERAEGLTLDRVDVNGDYCPDNCRWATREMQGFNQRKRSTNTSGRTGVYANGNSYIARIANRSLGSFKSFEAAVREREAAELETFGYIKEVWPCVK